MNQKNLAQQLLVLLQKETKQTKATKAKKQALKSAPRVRAESRWGKGKTRAGLLGLTERLERRTVSACCARIKVLDGMLESGKLSDLQVQAARDLRNTLQNEVNVKTGKVKPRGTAQPKTKKPVKRAPKVASEMSPELLAEAQKLLDAAKAKREENAAAEAAPKVPANVHAEAEDAAARYEAKLAAEENKG